LGAVAGFSVCRHGEDPLGPVRALCGHRHADYHKLADGIKDDPSPLSAKAGRIQTDSSRHVSHPAGNSHLVRVSEVFVPVIGFSGSVRMAWKRSIRVFHDTALVRVAAHMPKKEGQPRMMDSDNHNMLNG